MSLRTIFGCTAACCLLLLCCGTAQAGSFTGIGFPVGENASFAEGISPDGTFVVGSGDRSSPQAFRWSEQGGMETLGGTSFGTAVDASADGAAVVGEGSTDAAVRWTESDGIVGLGLLPGHNRSFAKGVSADGSVVTGASNDGLNTRAFRWTEAGGIEDLGVLQPGDGSHGTGISGDGSIIVGLSGVGNTVQAFRWTQADGMQGLAPAAGYDSAYATAISSDGSVIVGESFDSLLTDGQAVRWVDGGAAETIGTLTGPIQGQFASPTDISGDGSVIVGMSRDRPFLWTQIAGLRPLVDVFTDAGLDFTGWEIETVRGISDDGNSIVGSGVNPDGIEEGWIARLAPIPALGSCPGRHWTAGMDRASKANTV
jgi:probable HAF family extracellular repeat protein